jgi:hypothetical protein
MIGDSTRLSNANYEQQNLGFITDTLRPYLCRIEAEVIRKLLPTQGRKANKYVVSFDVSERQRGDFQTTMSGFATGRQWCWLNGNDVRTALGMNRGGPELDVYFAPVNMQNAELLLKTESVQDQPILADPAADPNSPVPTPAERALLNPVTVAYLRLFRDAIGRFTARSKRDSEAIKACFSPVLASISEEATRQAGTEFGLEGNWNESEYRNVQKALKSIEERASSWTPDQAESLTGPELTRAVRSILINTYRDAGAARAMKGLANA